MRPADCFEELDKALHERRTFDCGRKELNDFIQQSAVRLRDAGISKTMVLPAITESSRAKADICSFYTLSHTELKRDSLPPSLAKKLPRYSIPVMLIAQLAVHQKMHNLGLGKITLIQSLQHCLKINAHLPSHAIVVDSIDDEVRGFYEQYGFKPLETNEQYPLRLFLPMATVANLFA